jgi:hypothetical protein
MPQQPFLHFGEFSLGAGEGIKREKTACDHHAFYFSRCDTNSNTRVAQHTNAAPKETIEL